MTELHTLFLDLDDTLYPQGNGVWHAIGDRITLFLIDRLGLSEAEAMGMRRRYFEQYGTTLNGLRLHHQIDPADYLEFVHDLPLERYLQPDPALGRMLAGLRVQRVVFTNADRAHAERVLAALGIADAIGSIIDIYALEFANKPEPGAYLRAMAIAAAPGPSTCVLVDDMPRNLHPASGLGMTTVYVGPGFPPGPIDHRLGRIHLLPLAIPALLANHAG
jgi:putative hydrolase of the HAD superfamily